MCGANECDMSLDEAFDECVLSEMSSLMALAVHSLSLSLSLQLWCHYFLPTCSIATFIQGQNVMNVRAVV